MLSKDSASLSAQTISTNISTFSFHCNFFHPAVQSSSKPKAFIWTFSLGFRIKFLIQMREKSRSKSPSECWTGTGSHRCKFLSVSDSRNFTAEQGFNFTWMPPVTAIPRIALVLAFITRKILCSILIVFFQYRMKEIFNFFILLNLNSHFPAS